MNYDFFYPYEKKQNAYLVPMLRRLLDAVNIFTLIVLLGLSLGIYLLPINFWLHFDKTNTNLNIHFSLFEKKSFLAQLIPLFFIIIYIYLVYRVSKRYSFFYQSNYILLDRFIVYAWILIVSIYTIVLFNPHTWALNDYNHQSVGFKNFYHESEFISLYQSKLSQDVGYRFNLAKVIIITVLAVFKLVLCLLIVLFRPRYKKSYAQFLRNHRNQRDVMALFVASGQTDINDYFNADLASFNPHHPIKFYKQFKNSSYNKKN